MSTPPAQQRHPRLARVAVVAGLVLVLALAYVIRRDEIGQGKSQADPLAICPVANGLVKDNFGAPRSDHTHYGDDILAPWGEPVLATFAGWISNAQTTGGLIVTLTAPGGSFTVGKHLSAVTPEREVKTGDVIGYVGRLDVPGSLPHLHFEWHPGGGPAVDPYPYVSEVCPNMWTPGSTSGMHLRGASPPPS